MVAVFKDAEPFAFEGGDIGVLVVHGLTGSTQSMRYLGEGLHRRFDFTASGRGSQETARRRRHERPISRWTASPNGAARSR